MKLEGKVLKLLAAETEEEQDSVIDKMTGTQKRIMICSIVKLIKTYNISPDFASM